jgi:hypothetical protein
MVVRTLVKRRDRPRRCRQGLASTGSKVLSPRPRCTPFGRRLLYAARASPPGTTPKHFPLVRGSKGVVPLLDFLCGGPRESSPCSNPVCGGPRAFTTQTDETSGDAGITCLPLRACRRLRRFRVRNASRRPASRQSRISATLSTACGQPCGQHVHLARTGCGTTPGHRWYTARSPCGNLFHRWYAEFFQSVSVIRCDIGHPPPARAGSRGAQRVRCRAGRCGQRRVCLGMSGRLLRGGG